MFLVLTHIGRDLLVEAPGQMTLILSCLREAFLMADAPQQVRGRSLVQLGTPFSLGFFLNTVHCIWSLGVIRKGFAQLTTL